MNIVAKADCTHLKSSHISWVAGVFKAILITFQVEFEGISRREKEEIKLVKVAINVFVFIKTHRNVVEILRMNRCHRMLLGFFIEFM